ncbi:MAG TPA: hypothetical protein VH601_09825 [Bryobacteraceae bacterium]|jgi:hypothetical protein
MNKPTSVTLRKAALVAVDFHELLKNLILDKGVRMVTTSNDESNYKVTIHNESMSISRLAETPEEALERAYHAYILR